MMFAFFFLLGLTGFALALAVQMRFLISASFRRALVAKFGGDVMDPAHKKSVAQTALDAPSDAGAAYLHETYPRPVGHLRLARRVTTWSLPLIAVLLLAGRFGLNIL